MKKILIILTALVLAIIIAVAETTNDPKSIELSFSANATTGYAWTSFVLGGDSVTLQDAEGIYESQENPDQADGVGGTTTFTLNAVKPGGSIVIFTYQRGWENEPIEQRVFHIMVDQDLNLFATDVTESGVYEGTVTVVDAKDHSIILQTESLGEVSARFDPEMALPAAEEKITIYTDGTMTMSLPPIVNVFAWGSNPSELAR